MSPLAVTPTPIPGPLRARGGPGAAPGRYDYLFGDLLDRPWKPLGRSSDEWLAHVRQRAEDLFARDTIEGVLPASLTFFGQFVAHDLSFDVRTDLADTGTRIPSHRSPQFDLDAVYGAGPRSQPTLYQAGDLRKLAVAHNEFGEPDLARSNDASLDHPATTSMNRRRTALIGDPRNDENIVTSQLHLAFVRFHNRLVDEGHDFEQARHLTQLHYQWLVLHEFLPTVCGPIRLDEVRKTPSAQRIFPPSRGSFVPFEFAFAAFRFGHSLVGPTYHLSDGLEGDRDGDPLVFYTWDATDWRTRDASAAQTLDGLRVLPRRWTVQWDRFLPGRDERAQSAQRIDTRLSEPLRFLPLVVDRPVHRALAYRTLLRGWHLGLPSGQTLAQHIGEKPHPSDYANEDPLWIYVLREAEAVSRARPKHLRGHLGPVGARIVAEVCLRLLEADPRSLMHQRHWTPTVPYEGAFDLRSFLAYAGMPITRQDWEQVVGERA
jgi:hypothetical protein